LTLALTHLWLLVENMPRSLHFYQETLGLAAASNLGEYVELNVNENFLLALFERSSLQSSEPGPALTLVSGQHATLAFEVKSLDTFCAELRAKGISFASEETDHPEWGLRTIFLHDPDGNVLCLYAGIPEQGQVQ
jgi:catechol 2,3-dioxygenase-like lactoylglutathione lyase family enzyme